MAFSVSRPAGKNQEDIITSKVFVGNLSYSTTQAEVQTLFSEIGAVTEVFIPVDRATGQPRGFAFVQFADEGSVPLAISKFHGTELQGRRLEVNEATERAPRGPSNNFGPDDKPAKFKANKPKGSRRGLRGRKRGF